MMKSIPILALLVLSCASPQGAAKPARPNIIYILADDLGWNDVGWHGSEIKTPRLDALARESVELNSFYVYPSCTPTRAGLLTGRNPSRFGIRWPMVKPPLPIEAVTIADLLGSAGYATHHVGKWHLGPDFKFGPLRQGFQTAYGFIHGQIDHYQHHYKTMEKSWFRGEEFVDEPGHATDLLTREAVKIIQGPKDKPFFMYLAYSAPHYPLQDDEKWIRMNGGIAHKDRRLQAAMVSHMDDAIGQVLDALDAAGVRENTLVLFSSDNGGQKSWPHAPEEYQGKLPGHEVLGDNTPLRGWKMEAYEGAIRVPALAHWKGTLKPRMLEEVVSYADVLPTCARVAGAAAGPELKLDGRDVWPLIAGSGSVAQAPIYWYTRINFALRDGDWKLVIPAKDAAPELYDVRKDPYEKANLAAAHPDRVKALREQLDRLKAQDP